MAYSRAEHVCMREYLLAMKSSVAVSKTYSKKVPNRSTIHQLVTTFRDTRSVCDKSSSSDKTEESTAVHISSSTSAATIGCGCKNSALQLISSFCAWCSCVTELAF
jgi:hypothetical protein